LNKNRWEKEGEFPGLDEFSKILTLENLSEMDDDSFRKKIRGRFSYSITITDRYWLFLICSSSVYRYLIILSAIAKFPFIVSYAQTIFL